MLRERGASFSAELEAATRRLPEDVERGLWDGVARGLLTADGFGAVRARVGDARKPDPAGSRGLLRGAQSPTPAARPVVARAHARDADIDRDELAEAVAELLLRRWGVIFRDLAVHDSLRFPWRELQWALRRLEDRGLVRGGRFVTGFTGEQYALPEAVEQLAHVAKLPRTGERVTVNATDPLNLVGVIVARGQRPDGADAPGRLRRRGPGGPAGLSGVDIGGGSTRVGAMDRWDPDAELPIKLGPCSNGEFRPLPLGPVEREAIRRTRADAEHHARRLGVGRREFLRSLGGAALMLGVLAACHDDDNRAKGKRSGGTYEVDDDAATEPDAAKDSIAGDEVIVDVQTHYLNYDLAVAGGISGLAGLADSFPQGGCGEADARACYSVGAVPRPAVRPERHEHGRAQRDPVRRSSRTR